MHVAEPSRTNLLLTTDEPQTSDHVLKNFRGIFKIDFDEIELKQKIGSGGFSDVHFAKWKGTSTGILSSGL
jgi:hypothetical protein